MRHALISLSVAFAALAGGSQAAAPTLSVPIDQSARVALPAGTRDVMIGNPAIADVSVLDGRNAVVLGKGYGVTNLLVIDQLGRTVMERQIVVSAPEAGRVSVIRGPKVEEYACATGCERAGDADGK
ncbi:MAG: pilus assembly protein N-terminal domain-containing protein [Phenylobacterium sp.]|jgi:Flp pilus assembly secretin CpaC|uniref:pilus assembly protein N-terminal domain-containing protein n=1 Tax=Phenylobacterium sp. TaxID=1871053 RepID=UPI003918D75C